MRAEDAAALAGVRAESGVSLLELVEQGPVLLVFLRHFGCAFCRKAISEVAELKEELARRGVRPVFVHLGPADLAVKYFEYYGIADVERVCDPEAKVYALPMFALGKKNPVWQALNPAVLMGWLKGTIFQHGIGRIVGDGAQMPGVFFLKGAKVVRGFRHKTMADEVDYLKMVGRG